MVAFDCISVIGSPAHLLTVSESRIGSDPLNYYFSLRNAASLLLQLMAVAVDQTKMMARVMVRMGMTLRTATERGDLCNVRMKPSLPIAGLTEDDSLARHPRTNPPKKPTGSEGHAICQVHTLDGIPIPLYLLYLH